MVNAGRLLGLVVPPALGAFIAYSAFLVILHVGIGWFYVKRANVAGAAVYTSLALVLISSILFVFAKLALHTPPTPPATIPAMLLQKEVIFECTDEHGTLARCNKHPCNGHWKPPRAHHCSTCRRCYLGWDHHCVWIGNCVTMESRKLFLAFLALSSLAVPTLILPVAPTLWQHIVTAYYTSYHDNITRALWWDQWYSWVLFAGPLGRWPVGIAFGFRLLRLRKDPTTNLPLGSMISEPSLTIFIMVQVALCLALFTTAVLILGIRDVLQGHTTFDRITGPRGTLYWIPAADDDTMSGGDVVACPSGVNAYDLGWQRNWADLMARPLVGTVCRDRDTIPVVNATTVLRFHARHRLSV